MEYSPKIKTFKDLLVWQEAHKLSVLIYKITEKYPNREIYSLIDQMRRCSVSITSNIAEGFSRQGVKEKIQFYFTAKGSLTELENQLLLSKDVGYINDNDFNKIYEQIDIVGKLLTGLIKATRNFK